MYTPYDENANNAMTQQFDEEPREKSNLGAKIAVGAAAGVTLGVGGAFAANAMMNEEGDTHIEPNLPPVEENIGPAAEETAAPEPAPAAAPKHTSHAPEAPHEVEDLLGAEIIEEGYDADGNAYAVVEQNDTIYGVVDTDGDGMYDTAIYDANGDGNISSNEAFDISKQHLAVNTPAEEPIVEPSYDPTVEVANIEGEDVYFIDQESDGIYDYMAADLNHNGEIEENEIVDITEYAVTSQDIRDIQNESEVYVTEPDYVAYDDAKANEEVILNEDSDVADNETALEEPVMDEAIMDDSLDIDNIADDDLALADDLGTDMI